jgi:uncharacterized membrane protein
MVWLSLGVLIWAYSHTMKRVTPAFRAGLGEQRGKGLVTVLSFVALGLMIWGYRSADVVMLWQPPAALRHVNNALMLIAVVMIGMGNSKGRLGGLMRHPMLTSVVIWSVAHLLVNGDLASLILWGGLGLWAVFDMLAISRMEPAWVRPAPGPVRNDVIYVAVMLVVFGGIVWLHGWLGYPPLG